MSKSWGKPDLIGVGSVTALTTVEQDLIVITQQDRLTKSQLNLFVTHALGSNTSIQFRYYGRYTPGGVWFELPYRNVGTGAIASVPSIADASTPLSWIDDRPQPACAEFKVTVKGVGGASGTVNAWLMSRDN